MNFKFRPLVAAAAFIATPVSSTSPRLLNATLTAPVSAVVVERTTDDIVSVTALGGADPQRPGR